MGFVSYQIHTEETHSLHEDFVPTSSPTRLALFRAAVTVIFMRNSVKFLFTLFALGLSLTCNTTNTVNAEVYLLNQAQGDPKAVEPDALLARFFSYTKPDDTGDVVREKQAEVSTKHLTRFMMYIQRTCVRRVVIRTHQRSKGLPE